MKQIKKRAIELVDGETILYHILQKQIIQAFDTDNPPTEVKFMIEQLLLWGGVWFKPKTYKQIPVLLPYAVRDAACRKIDPATGKDTRGVANDRGLMPDDNSSIKGIPKSLTIESVFLEMNGKRLGKRFVASHCWRVLQNKPGILANQWERTNSFIPNLVWLPIQLSKLTDREGSYAQRFIQYVSGMLYRDFNLQNPMLSEIWDELKEPDITPVSEIKLDKLNYFEDNEKWISRRKDNLLKELQSILNILDGGSPIVKTINVSTYAPSLAEVVKSMETSDKTYLMKWITANMEENQVENDNISGVVIVDYTDPYDSFGWRGSIHIEIDLNNKTLYSAGWRNGKVPLSEKEAQKYLEFFSNIKNLNDFFNDRKAFSTPMDHRFVHSRWYVLRIQWNGREKEISVGYPDIPFQHPFGMY